MQSVSFLFYDDVDAYWAIQIDAVIIDETLGLETTVLPLDDCRLDLCFRDFQQAIKAGKDLAFAELVDQLLEPLLAQPVGPELTTDVAEHEFRSAAVGADEALDVGVGSIAALITHGRQVQAFVENLPGLAGAASRHRAADVALVRDRAAKAEWLRANKDRRNDRDVGRVRASALIRMIDDEGIPRRDACAEHLDDGGGAGRKRADMQRQHHMLRHDLAPRVHQGAGGILRLPHDGGVAGAEQRILHLLHDAGEAGLDDFEIDRVGRAHRDQFSCVTIRFFHSSTRATWPGLIRVVQSSCSRMAGPLMPEPTSSRSRS